MTMRAARLALVCSVLAIAGCGSAPPRPPAATADRTPAPARPAGVAAFEVRTRERAESEGREGRLAEAATDWEVLTVLQPGNAEYRDRLDETRRLIEDAVPERLERGRQDVKRGDLDGATTQYLMALALDPGNATAAEALRGIERERNKRNFLGKPSRLTLTRRETNEALVPTPAASTAQSSGRNDLEDAAALRAQGELIDAIALLERHLAADKRDVAACQMLAEMYFEQGEAQVGHDDANAAIWYQKSLRLDASNEQAAERLKQLKKDAVVAGGGAGARGSCVARR
jgi:tetratricopeptide (TPR) repeat protein